MNSVKTLIVDDHLGMRSTLQDILEDYGFLVSSAASGEEAVKICKENDFDVILMDVRLPGINGVETLKKIKKFSKATRIIMMSAFSMEDLKKKAIQEGALTFLQKPLNIPVVIELIEEDKANIV
jgi:DNA-binding NtrC family response regulator